MKVRGLHHAQITVPKGAEDEARRFYCSVLGLKEVEKPESLQGRGGFWLEAGDRQVHVGTEDGVDRARTKAHLAYEVDDVGAWRAHFASHGVEILDSVPIPGCERFGFRDPFGNRGEMIQRV
ncbi:MAG: VOC family protein [Armatimonadetes bacterium]|nr:VOC family protein [Armatimonadota bacterium]